MVHGNAISLFSLQLSGLAAGAHSSRAGTAVRMRLHQMQESFFIKVIQQNSQVIGEVIFVPVIIIHYYQT